MIQNDIGEILKDKDNFAIISHVSPDGDSIGSALGLYNALIEAGKNADVFIDDEIPKKYSFLPGYEKIKRQMRQPDKYEYLFVLDCGDELRMGSYKPFINSGITTVNIDHHISNNLFGNINFVDSNASSVGEIIYGLLKINGFNISCNTAMCLYTSLLTDTGGFKYSNTTSMTFNIAGDLINTGIDFSFIYSMIYDIKTLPQVRLMAMVASTLSIEHDGKTAILTLTPEMLSQCMAKESDADEFINIARDIDTVEVGIFIKQIDCNTCRVSLRSKNIVDVRAIASMFNGGGHVRAAGCTIEGNIDEVKSKIVTAVKDALSVM